MTATATTEKTVKVRPNYESIAWKWMRYSALLLIPLVWIHTILQDVVVGVHSMDLGYVAERWASIGWRLFDAFLLGFAFAHGMNGLRQVLADFIHSRRVVTIMNWVLFIAWLAIFLFGLIALLAGVKQQFPTL